MLWRVNRLQSRSMWNAAPPLHRVDEEHLGAFVQMMEFHTALVGNTSEGVPTRRRGVR
jgi:hypothetical protein